MIFSEKFQVLEEIWVFRHEFIEVSLAPSEGFVVFSVMTRKRLSQFKDKMAKWIRMQCFL